MFDKPTHFCMLFRGFSCFFLKKMIKYFGEIYSRRVMNVWTF